MKIDFSVPQISVFLGKPKRGKSYALRHTILKNTIDNKIFKYGIVFTRTKFNGDYDWLPDDYVYDDYDPQILQTYLDGLKDLPKDKLKPSFIIFDDIQGALDPYDKTLNFLNACHRHMKISIFYCFQYIYGRGSTPVLRSCTTMAFLFNAKGERTLKALYEAFGQLFPDFNTFKDYYLQLTAEPYTAMLYFQDEDNIDDNYLQYQAPPPEKMKHVKKLKLDY